MEENLSKLSLRYHELLSVSYSLDNWTRLVDRGSVAVYAKPTDIGFNAYKYEIYIDKPAESLSAFLFSHRCQLSRILMQDEHAQILTKQLAPWAVSYSIVTNSFAALTKPREFDVFCVRLKVKQGTWANLGVSVDAPLSNSQAIKGEFVYLSEIFEELDLNRTKLTIVFLVNPKGKFPRFLYKKVVKSRLRALDDLLLYLATYVA